MQVLVALLKSMRPRQWTKNVIFVFPAIVFSAQLFEVELFLRVAACSILLILTSSSVYIINDLADIEADRQHPTKKRRPIASGELPLSLARVTAVVLPALVLTLSSAFDDQLTLLLVAYYLLQIMYSLRIKHVVLLDIMAVASGFVLRVIAGAVVIDVSISPWLYTSAGLLALFLVIGKRRQELAALGERATETRPIFRQYNLRLLDDMLRVVTTSTMITYILYTVESSTMVKYDTNWGLLTVPIVVYGLFRYLYLIHVKGEGAAPDEVLLTDRPMQITILVAALSYFLIVYLI